DPRKRPWYVDAKRERKLVVTEPYVDISTKKIIISIGTPVYQQRDASPMSHPIRPDKVIEMNNFYTLTVYEKGSEVIRMMHTLLGEEKFQRGMK
ncbi:M1 family aminopeptidase, partial [Vibrio cholerae]|uniref:M1 family aminopeptidase n=1 Tax=Vibrio cholerae TaxID=666 RepID=UPI0011251777